MTTTTTAAAFRELHTTGCFMLPNPWDRGSAVLFQSLGFKALATSSAAVCFMHGRAEKPGSLELEMTLANVQEVASATSLPVTADFQDGYGATPAEVGGNVLRCVNSGAAGLSIEDATPDPSSPIYDLDTAVRRVEAARTALREAGSDAVLTARCEYLLLDAATPLPTIIDRLVKYAEAGADCLFAPGLRSPDDISAVVRAVEPLPVNVLAVDPSWMSLDALANLGARRVSVGSALARVGWQAIRQAAAEIVSTGSLRPLEHAATFDSMNDLFD